MEINLSKQIEEYLKEYGADVVDAVNEAAEEAAKATVKLLKSTSPRNKGDYASGWKFGKETGILGKRSMVIYNGKRPGLTHLLEKGHAIRGGHGRTAGQEHIKPAESYAIRELEKNVKKKIESI